MQSTGNKVEIQVVAEKVQVCVTVPAGSTKKVSITIEPRQDDDDIEEEPVLFPLNLVGNDAQKDRKTLNVSPDPICFNSPEY